MRHRDHVLIDRLVLGRAYREVHRWMDEPYRWLGPRHRVLRHDPLTLLLRFGLGEEFVSGMLHIAADEASSALRRRRGRRGSFQFILC